MNSTIQQAAEPQVCLSGTRLLVHENIADAFAEAFAAKAAQIAPPTSPPTSPTSV